MADHGQNALNREFDSPVEWNLSPENFQAALSMAEEVVPGPPHYWNEATDTPLFPEFMFFP